VKARRLALVLGDQLNLNSTLFDSFDPSRDVVWMAEVHEESVHVPSHKARTALFLSAMRHFRDRLRSRGFQVDYTLLSPGSLGEHLASALQRLRPESVTVVQPGEFRVERELLAACPRLRILEDEHFYCSRSGFNAWAAGRKQLRQEYFYRELRKRHNVLMDGGAPSGGEWNYDAVNRQPFGKRGPGVVPAPRSFPPDETTREVLELVASTFPSNPGSLRHFDWPVTAEQAVQALDDFIANRLPNFGGFQDAMWSGEPWLHHSRISAALNLKLLDPRQAVQAAETAYRHGCAPLPAVEGFIRQILGWREYVRGIYWRYMPHYSTMNALDAHAPLPDFYWTGGTDMNCLSQVIGQTLEYGYAHHIQRLMVTGLFALLSGVEPRRIHEWYLAVYVDAVEWVELPNVVGMSQFADGGIMASKPYAATGKYIQKMSNYCSGCRYDPAQSEGDDACPFTVRYWDFLERNRVRLSNNPRMRMQLRNLERRISKR
jgi:deoxyribodipyrimidine photolyase-related protein